MKVSFLSPDHKELIILPSDYFDIREAIFDFFLFKEETHSAPILSKKYKDWKIFRNIKVGQSCTVISSINKDEETISDHFGF